MSLKNTDFDIVVVGSGLSSLSFIDSYLEKNKKINVISPNFKLSNTKGEYSNSHIDHYLPPQMSKKLNEVKNFFFQNKLIINKNSKVFGSLQFGGLSNYWGLQIDGNISDDIVHLNHNVRRKIKKSFVDIFKKFSFLGEANINNKVYKNSYNTNLFPEKIMKKNKTFDFSKPIIAYRKKNIYKKKNINLKLLNEKKDKFNANNYYNFFLKKKKIIFHNYVVNKIYSRKNKIYLDCSNQKIKKIFTTKKLILGCGTLATTKLILDFLKIKKEIKIKHHPRLFSFFMSKYKSDNNMQFTPSTINVRDKKNPNFFVMDFRPGNKLIVNSIIDFKKYLYPFKFLLNYFRKYMIFSNIFLDSKYSNLFIKLQKNSKAIIYSKQNKVSSIFKKIHKRVHKFLIQEKLIFPIFYNYFPGFGADFHYFGTIPITKNNKKLTVNDKCQLKMYKNIYIVDGSVLDFKVNKYPLGIIMANARRIGKEIK